MECFDETSRSVYYWNTKTNECSWDPPSISTKNHNCTGKSWIELKKKTCVAEFFFLGKKRTQVIENHQSPKKSKKPNLIAEYASSESETSEQEENADDIDELLEEVLEKEEKKSSPTVDLYPLFEADCRTAIARLVALGDRTTEILRLRIQLEVKKNFFNRNKKNDFGDI